MSLSRIPAIFVRQQLCYFFRIMLRLHVIQCNPIRLDTVFILHLQPLFAAQAVHIVQEVPGGYEIGFRLPDLLDELS